MVEKSILSIVILISIVFVNLKMYGEFTKKEILRFEIIGIILITGLIIFFKLNYIETIKYTLLLSLLYSACITDFRSNDIVGSNTYLMYLYVLVFFIIDFMKGNNIITKLLICLITYFICRILNNRNIMGEGDNSIMISTVYTFGLYSSVVFGMACLISLILGIVKYKREVVKAEIPLAPGIFITVVSIGYLLLYQYIKIASF